MTLIMFIANKYIQEMIQSLLKTDKSINSFFSLITCKFWTEALKFGDVEATNVDILELAIKLVKYSG